MQSITKELLEKKGIYCIINIINNKQYIGSSKNLYTRLNKHCSTLRGNSHTNRKLQNSWNKYLEDNFRYFILEYCEEKDLLKREQFYIDTMSPKLNITLLAERNILTKESRILQSETRKKRIKSGEITLFGKKIYQYDLNGKFIKEYEYIKEACIENNIHQSTICRFLNGTYKKAGNFLWALDYKEFLQPYEKPKHDLRKLHKKVNVLDYKTNEIIYTFNSLKECADYFKCAAPSISNAIKVKQKFKKKYLIVKA